MLKKKKKKRKGRRRERTSVGGLGGCLGCGAQLSGEGTGYKAALCEVSPAAHGFYLEVLGGH